MGLERRGWMPERFRKWDGQGFDDWMKGEIRRN